MSGNNQEGAQEAPTWLDEWSGRTPAVTRYTIFATLIPSAICWILGMGFTFANCPIATLLGLQLWRLFTAPFVANGLLSMILSTVIFASMAPRRERELGSVGFLLLMMVFGWGTQVLFCTIIIILAFNPVYSSPLMAMSCSSGLSVIWLAMMAYDCAENPEQERRLLFFPVKVKNKFYPFILVGIFSLIFGIQFDSFAALFMGYLYAWGYLDFAKPSPDRLRVLENGRLNGMTQWMGYVAVDEAGAPVPTGGPGADPERGGGGASGDVFGRGRNTRPGGGGGAGAGAGGGQSGGPQVAFPGSGHSLGSAPGTTLPRPSAPSSRSGGAGGAGAGPKSGGKGAVVAETRRQGTNPALAALERRLGIASSSPGAGAGSGASDPPASSGSGGGSNLEFKLMQMQDLGFDRSAARAALVQTGGDVDRAASLLSST